MEYLLSFSLDCYIEESKGHVTKISDYLIKNNEENAYGVYDQF
jgi:hypothetical protein